MNRGLCHLGVDIHLGSVATPPESAGCINPGLTLGCPASLARSGKPARSSEVSEFLSCHSNMTWRDFLLRSEMVSTTQ